MHTREALASLGSLAQETRLGIYRLLVQTGPEGLPAGAIAEALGVPPSSLSFHLHQLLHSGLIEQTRRSRQRIYAASYPRMNALLAYLTENCCGGASCAPGEPVKLGLPEPADTPSRSRRRAGGARR